MEAGPFLGVSCTGTQDIWRIDEGEGLSEAVVEVDA